MNILFYFYLPIIPHIGGAQRVTDILAQEFIKKGHNVFFLCSAEYEDLVKEYPNFSAPQYFLKFDFSENSKIYIKKILEDNNINVIINQFDLRRVNDSLSLFDCANPCIKKITCYHSDPFYFVGKERRIASVLRPNSLKVYLNKYSALLLPKIFYYLKTKQFISAYNKVIKASDKFCLLSDSFIPEFSRIMNLSKVDKNKVYAVNNPNTFSEVSLIGAYELKENIILYVGRLMNPAKSPIDFLKMWENLHCNNPTWRAVVVGDGPELKNMQEYVEKHKLTNIYFEGNQSNVVEYFQKAKFVCITSNYEGWGMVLTEGMACGCIPLAYGTFGAAYDIIDSGINGYVTTPFSPKDMAEKIQGLIDNPSMAEQFSELSKLKVKTFSVEKIVDQWEILFESL